MKLEPLTDALSFLIKDAGHEGADILVRPIEARDRHLLVLGFDQLSERSRYFRFLMRRDALTDDELDFLTAKNTDDHVALGALDLCCDPPRPTGIARFVRNEDAPETAEVAITISDRYQGQGIGKILLAALAMRAASIGLSGFTALVHNENAAMLHIFSQLGGEAEPASAGEARVVIPLHKSGDGYPLTSVGETFRKVFAGLETI